MAAGNPFEQLTGPCKVYIAPYGEPVPEINIMPAGNWVLLGSTDGDQKIKHGAKTTTFKDNDHQGPVKVIRHEEDIDVKFKVVDLSMENYAYIIHNVSKITSGLTSVVPVTYKRMPLKRGATLFEYAMLFRGPTASPYGIYPGMYVFPRCVNVSEPETTWGKNQRVALEVGMQILEDDAQTEDDQMGWLIVQA
ncbi:hypothetical protein SE17_01220 [Kouleothrix aurantiaca]|uniref:Uncharacterized protein n=1 Tax=Kouleothrix aurantiaca TaxID=186479 RepID=A0A0N8PT90_9CHLR|nr:hypothetical protein SE17_01220 [Kouleothrix aurantiaca]